MTFSFLLFVTHRFFFGALGRGKSRAAIDRCRYSFNARVERLIRQARRKQVLDREVHKPPPPEI